MDHEESARVASRLPPPSPPLRLGSPRQLTNSGATSFWDIMLSPALAGVQREPLLSTVPHPHLHLFSPARREATGLLGGGWGPRSLLRPPRAKSDSRSCWRFRRRAASCLCLLCWRVAAEPPFPWNRAAVTDGCRGKLRPAVLRRQLLGRRTTCRMPAVRCLVHTSAHTSMTHRLPRVRLESGPAQRLARRSGGGTRSVEAAAAAGAAGVAPARRPAFRVSFPQVRRP